MFVFVRKIVKLVVEVRLFVCVQKIVKLVAEGRLK